MNCRQLSVGYWDLALELESLQKTLTLTRLVIQVYENKPLGNSLANTITPEILRCFAVLQELLNNLNGTCVDLSITSVSGVLRQIQRWFWCEEDEEKFTLLREQLSVSRQSFQGLLIALRSYVLFLYA
jgi:hypothetical protein